MIYMTSDKKNKKKIPHLKISNAFHLLYTAKGSFCCFIFVFGLIFLLPENFLSRLPMSPFIYSCKMVFVLIWWLATSILITDFLCNLRLSTAKKEKKLLSDLRALNDESAALVYKLYAFSPYHKTDDLDQETKGNIILSMATCDILIQSGKTSFILNPTVTKILEQKYLLRHYIEVQYNHQCLLSK